jgi:hypothetical protein
MKAFIPFSQTAFASCFQISSAGNFFTRSTARSPAFEGGVEERGSG